MQSGWRGHGGDKAGQSSVDDLDHPQKAPRGGSHGKGDMRPETEGRAGALVTRGLVGTKPSLIPWDTWMFTHACTPTC